MSDLAEALEPRTGEVTDPVETADRSEVRPSILDQYPKELRDEILNRLVIDLPD